MTMSRFIDLTGQRFGKLVVIKFMGRLNFHSMYHCACDCGGLTIATSNNLRRNHTTSCGCQSSRNNFGTRTTKTHGKRNHPLYESWIGMRNRCYWPKHNRYEYYGGKGISVCNEWRDDFMAFYKWAKSNGWKKGLQIDRIDNNGNYCPSNCRFATIKQQSRNRTTNVKLTIDGQTKILIEWSEISGINPVTIRRRIKNGWPTKYAVFKKVS